MSLSQESIDALKQLAREEGWIGKEKEVAKSKRPQFKLPTDNRELHDLARDLGEVAVVTQKLFRRDRTPVIENEKKKRLDVLKADQFRTWISDYAACFRLKKVELGEGEFEYRPAMRTMNLDTARGVLESAHFWEQLPEIERLNQTRLPIFRADGRLDLLKPGYFPEQAIFTLNDRLIYDETLSLEDARKIIDDFLSEFPFKDARSKAAMIAGMLTMFCATLLPRRSIRPAFLFTANSVGAGKTLGAKFCIIPVVGSAAPRSLPRKEEAKKVLDIIAMDAANYVLFDNVRGKIQGEDIETFITSAEVEGRLLGASEKFRCENVATVFFTGNQSSTSQDMADRCLKIELFVEEADNRDRVITRVIDDSFLAQSDTRASILSALWAFSRAWFEAGKPVKCGIMQRFEAWSRVVPAIAEFAGYGDATIKPPDDVGGEVTDMRELVKALAPTPTIDGEQQRSLEYEFDELISKIRELDLFADMLEARAGRRDNELFAPDGRATSAGKSLFGKLFARYDHRRFTIADRKLRFVLIGRGDSRRYLVEVD